MAAGQHRLCTVSGWRRCASIVAALLLPIGVVATEFPDPDGAAMLDVDRNGEARALSDGLLVLRYLFGFRGDALVAGVIEPGATRSSGADIETHLGRLDLDVDGDGNTTALGDGLLVLRRLFEFSGSALADGAMGANATRSADALAAHIDTHRRGRDTDGDGTVDLLDDDDDGDGVGDHADAFPLVAGERADTDFDGIGDNADTDDDNDGIDDAVDADPRTLPPNRLLLQSSLDLGAVTVGRTGNAQLLVRNPGDAPITLLDARASNANFTATPPSGYGFPFLLGPLDSVELDVLFAPPASAAGTTLNDVLRVRASATPSLLEVALRGTARAAVPTGVGPANPALAARVDGAISAQNCAATAVGVQFAARDAGGAADTFVVRLCDGGRGSLTGGACAASAPQPVPTDGGAAQARLDACALADGVQTLMVEIPTREVAAFVGEPAVKNTGVLAPPVLAVLPRATSLREIEVCGSAREHTQIAVAGGTEVVAADLGAGETQFCIVTPLQADRDNVLIVTATDATAPAPRPSARSAPVVVTQVDGVGVDILRASSRPLAAGEVAARVAAGTLDAAAAAAGTPFLVTVDYLRGGLPSALEQVVILPTGDGAAGAGANRCDDDCAMLARVPVVDGVALLIPGVVVVPTRGGVGELLAPTVALFNPTDGTLRDVTATLSLPAGLTPVGAALNTHGTQPVLALGDIAPGGTATASLPVRAETAGEYPILVEVAGSFAPLALPAQAGRVQALATRPPTPFAGRSDARLDVKRGKELELGVRAPVRPAADVDAGSTVPIVIDVANRSQRDVPFASLQVELGDGLAFISPQGDVVAARTETRQLGGIRAGSVTSTTVRIRTPRAGDVLVCQSVAGEHLVLAVDVGTMGAGCAVTGMHAVSVGALADELPVNVLTLSPANGAAGVPVDASIALTLSPQAGCLRADRFRDVVTGTFLNEAGQEERRIVSATLLQVGSVVLQELDARGEVRRHIPVVIEQAAAADGGATQVTLRPGLADPPRPMRLRHGITYQVQVRGADRAATGGVCDLATSAPIARSFQWRFTARERIDAPPLPLELAPGERVKAVFDLFPRPAPGGGVQVAFTTSDPTVVAVETPVVTVAAGGRRATVDLIARGRGEARIQATARGFDSAAVSARVSSRLDVLESTLQLTPGESASATVQIRGGANDAPRPARTDTTVLLTSSNPDCVVVDATAQINKDQRFTTFALRPGTGQSAACTATVTATGGGHAEDTLVVRVAPAGEGQLNFHCPQRIAVGLQEGCVVSANEDGLRVQVAVSDPALALVSADLARAGTPSVEVAAPEPGVSGGFVVQGLAPGNVTLTLRAAGRATVRHQLTIEPPSLRMLQLPSPITTLSGPQPLTVDLLPSGTVSPVHGPLLVTVASGNAASGLIATESSPAGQAQVTVAIPPGRQSATFLFVPVAAGEVPVTASASGFDPANNSVSVREPAISLDCGDALGIGLERVCFATLEERRHGGVKLRFEVDRPERAVVAGRDEQVGGARGAGSATYEVAVPDGVGGSAFVVQGVAAGAVTITASADRFVAARDELLIGPPRLRVDLPFTPLTATSEVADFAVRLLSPDGTVDALSAAQGPLAVTVNSSAPNVVLLKSPQSLETLPEVVVHVAARSSGPMGLQLVPRGVGTTTITATATGFEGGSAVQQVAGDALVFRCADPVGAGLQRACAVDVRGTGHGGTDVVIASDAPSIARVASYEGAGLVGAGSASITLRIPDGASTGFFALQGVALGAATLTATSSRFASATATVDVVQPALGFPDLRDVVSRATEQTPFRVRVLPNGDSVSGAGPLTVTVRSGNPAVALLVTPEQSAGAAEVTVTIPPNHAESSPENVVSRLSLKPVAAGEVTITASAAGFIGASRMVRVPDPGIVLAEHCLRPLAAGLQRICSVYLEGQNTGGVTVRVGSGDISIARIAPGALTAGTGFVDVHVPPGGVGSFVLQGVTPGTMQMTATAAGFMSATQTVEIRQGALDFLRFVADLDPQVGALAANVPFEVGGGTNEPGDDRVSAATGPLRITLSSSNPAVARLVSPAHPGGAASVSVDVPVNADSDYYRDRTSRIALDPVAAGDVVISASAAGFAPVSRQVTVLAPRLSIRCPRYGNVNALMARLQYPCVVLVDGAGHGGTTVRVRSSASSIAVVAPADANDGTLEAGNSAIDVFIPDGSEFAAFMLQGVSPGPVTLSASADRFEPATLPLQIAAGELLIGNLPETTTTRSPPQVFEVVLPAPASAASGPLTVTLTSSDGAVAQLATVNGNPANSVTLVFPVNTQASQSVSLVPGAAGVTTISVMSPTFTPATRVVTVQAPPLAFAGISQLRAGLQTEVFVSLGVSNHGGTTVRFGSSDGGVALVAPYDEAVRGALVAGNQTLDVQVPDGQFGARVMVQGVAAGTAVLRATAPMFSAAEQAIDVGAARLRLQPIHSRTALDPDRVIEVFLDGRRSAAAGPLTVTVASSNPAVGVITTSQQPAGAASQTVVIPVNADRSPQAVVENVVPPGAVAFRGIAAGSTVVSAEAPGHLPASVEVEVTAAAFALDCEGTAVGLQSYCLVTLRTPAPAGGRTVRIAVDAPDLARVAPYDDAVNGTLQAGSAFVDVNVAAGREFTSFVLQGRAQGSPVLTVSAQGYTTMVRQLTIVTAELELIGPDETTPLSTPARFDVAVRSPLASGSTVSAGGGPLLVAVATSDVQVARLITPDAPAGTALANVSIPVNAGSVPLTLAGGNTGVVTLTATAAGRGSASRTVTVRQPRITLDCARAVGARLQRQCQARLERVADAAVTVRITSSDPNVLVLAPYDVQSQSTRVAGAAFIDVSIPQVEEPAQFVVQGVAPGTASIRASLAGFAAQEQAVTIEPARLRVEHISSISASAANQPFHVHLETPTTAVVDQVSAAGGPLTVTIESSNPAVGRITTPDTPGGAGTATIVVPVGSAASAHPESGTGIGAAFDPIAEGTTVITVRAPGFITDSYELNVGP